MANKFTQRFRLNKPDFRESPWSALLNDNTDRLDSIIYNALQANNISTYENGVDVEAGQIMYDPELETFWICGVSHTTAAVGTFEEERTANPTYWTSIQFGLNPRGQWQQETQYAYYDLAYDANEGVSGLCLVPHVSPNAGTMRDEADKWVFIIDVQAGGGVAAVTVTYDDTNVPFVAVNAQAAIDGTNTRIDNAATIVAGIQNDLDTLSTTVGNHTTSLTNIQAELDATQAAEIIVAATSGDLTAERVLTDTGSIDWDFATAGQAKASLADDAVTLAKLADEIYASQAEAEAGTATSVLMNPLRVKQAIVANPQPVDIADVTGLGTAAAKDVGTGAGNVVQLDPITGKLPAVDGSSLTNLPSPGYNVVGSYAMLGRTSGITAGSSYAGSGLSLSGVEDSGGGVSITQGSAMTGTWLALGSAGGNTFNATLFKRTA